MPLIEQMFNPNTDTDSHFEPNQYFEFPLFKFVDVSMEKLKAKVQTLLRGQTLEEFNENITNGYWKGWLPWVKTAMNESKDCLFPFLDVARLMILSENDKDKERICIDVISHSQCKDYASKLMVLRLIANTLNTKCASTAHFLRSTTEIQDSNPNILTLQLQCIYNLISTCNPTKEEQIDVLAFVLHNAQTNNTSALVLYKFIQKFQKSSEFSDIFRSYNVNVVQLCNSYFTLKNTQVVKAIEQIRGFFGE
jgi:hypothetical protein